MNKRQKKNNLIVLPICVVIGIITGVIVSSGDVSFAMCLCWGIIAMCASYLIIFIITGIVSSKKGTTGQEDDDSVQEDGQRIVGLPRIIILIAVIVAISSLVFGVATTEGFYKDATSSRHLSVSKNTGHDCQYPNCTEQSSKEIELKAFKIFGGAYDKILSFNNSADFSVESDSFTYTPKEKHVAYDDATLLVPVGGGIYGIVNVEYQYEYTTEGVGHKHTYVTASGYYCDEHADIAEKSLLKEIKDEFISKNPLFWILCIAIPVVCIVVIVVVVIRSKKTEKKKAE